MRTSRTCGGIRPRNCQTNQNGLANRSPSSNNVAPETNKNRRLWTGTRLEGACYQAPSRLVDLRPSMKMPHRLHKLPAFGHQRSSERDEFLFVRIIEACVQGLGRVDDLREIGLALPNAVRLRQVAIHRC